MSLMEQRPWFSVDVVATTPVALSDDELDNLFKVGANVIEGLGPGDWRSVWGIEAATADMACQMAVECLTMAVSAAKLESATARSEAELDASLT